MSESGAVECRAGCGDTTMFGTQTREVQCESDDQDQGVMRCTCYSDDSVRSCGMAPKSCDTCDAIFRREWPDAEP